MIDIEAVCEQARKDKLAPSEEEVDKAFEELKKNIDAEFIRHNPDAIASSIIELVCEDLKFRDMQNDTQYLMLNSRLKETKKKLKTTMDTIPAKQAKTVYISMHELDLTKKYAETVMLFYPNHDIDLGTPEEVMTDEDLEKAYKIPVSMLKHSETMTRNQIKEESEMIKKL